MTIVKSPENLEQKQDRIDIRVINEAPKKKHRKAKMVAALGLTGLAALGLVDILGGLGFGTKEGGTVNSAKVFRVTPEEVDCRVMTQSRIGDTVSKTFKTPVDHKFVIGDVVRFFERTFRETSQFNGEIDTMTCFRAAGVQVNEKANGKEIIDIPTSSVVTFSAVNEANSLVTRNDGNLAALGEFVWSIAGNILPHEKATVVHGRAALDAVARAEAVDVASTNCAAASWTEAKSAAQEAYRIIGEQEYELEESGGAHLKHFNPNSITVNFTGSMPDFEAPYTLPGGVAINDTVKCTVVKNAYRPIHSYVNAANQPVPTSLNAI